MEKGFFHTSRGYWQTTNEPPQHILDTFPAGTVEVPLKPGADFEWNGSEWVAVPPDPAQQLAAERAAMSATRGQFLIAAVGAGIITEATAEEAAGGGWPAAFDAFMAGLSAPQRIAAKAAWVDGDKVRRTNPILALIAADQSVSPDAVDDLFRAAMEIDL